MKILIISHYFYPENFIINSIAKRLSKNNSVTVFTPQPSYPNKYIFKKFIQSKDDDTYCENIKIIRYPVIKRTGKSLLNLFINYLSSLLIGSITLPFKANVKDQDIILVYLPSPVFTAIPAMIVKLVFNKKLVIWVQDLWPDVILSNTSLRNKYIYSFIGWIVSKIYNYSDLILTSSKQFVGEIKKKTKTKIIFYPNSLDVSDISKNPISDSMKQEINGSFNILFSGNLGRAQGLDTIINSCKRLLVIDETIKIFLVGDGSMKNYIRNKISELQLSNLKLLGAHDFGTMLSFYEHSDLLLMSFSNNDNINKTVPFKLLGYLASGKPIIASAAGATADVIKDSESGIFTPPGDIEILVQKIIELKSMSKKEREIMGKNGKDYFKKNFELRHRVKELEGILKGLLK